MPRALARVLLAGGGASEQPPEYRPPQKKSVWKTRMLSPRLPIFAFFALCGVARYRGLRFTLGYEPLASLGHSTFQVVLQFSGCSHRGIEGIQPERLNAEGDSPSACSRGLSVSATPGTVCLQGKRLKDAKTAAVICTDHHKKCARVRYCVIRGCGLRILPAMCAIFRRVALRCWWRGRSSPSPRCIGLLLRRWWC